MSPTNPSPPHLLTLPSELREQIWSWAFSNTHITSFERWYLGPSPTTREVSCDPCNQEWNAIFPNALSYRLAFGPLLSCKQIYSEARMKLLSSFILHLDTPHAITGATTRYESHVAINLTGNARSKHHNLNRVIRDNARRLCLYIHIDDFTRGSWFTALGHLRRSFPNLERIDVHNHMRPPTSYDNLVDAIYLVGPLCTLGEPFDLSENFERPRTAGDDDDDGFSSNHGEENEAESSGQDQTNGHAVAHPLELSTSTQQEPDALKLPPPRNLHLHLAYPQPNVPMFQSPHLGQITSSDSLYEHSLVVRELFSDIAFRNAAQQKRQNEMTGALLAVAREHERPWLERLERRRLVAMRMEMMGWDRDVDLERRRRRRREVVRLVRREAREREQETEADDVNGHAGGDDGGGGEDAQEE